MVSDEQTRIRLGNTSDPNSPCRLVGLARRGPRAPRPLPHAGPWEGSMSVSKKVCVTGSLIRFQEPGAEGEGLLGYKCSSLGVREAAPAQIHRAPELGCTEFQNGHCRPQGAGIPWIAQLHAFYGTRTDSRRRFLKTNPAPAMSPSEHQVLEMPPLASSPPRAGSAPLPPSPKCPPRSQGAPQGWRHVATGARDSQMDPGVGSAGSPAGPPGTSYRGPPGPGPSSSLSPKGGPGVGEPGLQLPSRLTASPRPRQAGDRLTGDTRGRGPHLVSLYPLKWPHGSADPFLVPCGSRNPLGPLAHPKAHPWGC